MFIWKRKTEAAAELHRQAVDLARRNRQLNLKVSEDCSIPFAAIAEAQGIGKAAPFEDLVAELVETLQVRGLKLEVAGG